MRETIQNQSISSSSKILFRTAQPTDGVAVWQMVQQVGTLELNTAYFYVLFCTDFRDTCLVALDGDEVIGAIIGYRQPQDPDVAFCWQIGVMPAWRGKGLAGKMLKAWVELEGNQSARWIKATVAEDNQASQSLFKRLASDLGVNCRVRKYFTTELLPSGHCPEPIYEIGPVRVSASERHD